MMKWNLALCKLTRTVVASVEPDNGFNNRRQGDIFTDNNKWCYFECEICHSLGRGYRLTVKTKGLGSRLIFHLFVTRQAGIQQPTDAYIFSPGMTPSKRKILGRRWKRNKSICKQSRITPMEILKILKAILSNKNKDL